MTSKNTDIGQDVVSHTHSAAKQVLGLNLQPLPPKLSSEDGHVSQTDTAKRTIVHTVFSLLSGAVAGAVAKTAIAPLDRTKISFQVSHQPFTVKAAINFLAKSYRNYGVKSWWRGNSATMARIVPYAALQFTIHEEMKLILKTHSSQTVLPPVRRFLAGSVAGVTAVAITYPLDMVRARLAVSRREKYANLRNAFSKIYHEEGFRTFYRGIWPTVLGIMPYAGISFFTYETLKSSYHLYTDIHDIHPAQRLAFGACAGILGQSSSYPLDIVRRRMQTDGLDGGGYRYHRIVQSLKFVWANEGLIGGLYKGMSLNWIKGPVAVGISFTTFDLAQIVLKTIIPDEYLE